MKLPLGLAKLPICWTRWPALTPGRRKVYSLRLISGDPMAKKLPAKPAINLTAEKPVKLARPALVGAGEIYKVPVGSFEPPGLGNVGPGKRRK